MPRDGVAGRTHSLIVRSDDGRIEPLTISARGVEVLPVFSFREEAEMYFHLCLGASEHGWRIGEISDGGLASILCGPYREVKAVTLDPLPEACGGALNGLLSVGREEFVRALLDGKCSDLP
jgi:hypothetical protein